LQTRRNARIVFVGSMKLFSNRFLAASIMQRQVANSLQDIENVQFVSELTKWNFGEKSVLRVRNVTHFSLEEILPILNPNRYRARDKIEFSFVVEEYRGDCDCWEPYQVGGIEFQLIRLDPFVRHMMHHVGVGRYKTTFTVPDVFGIYKMIANVKSRGWSFLDVEEVVTVRPFRHDEYARFLLVAFPYYCGTFTAAVGFVVFLSVFMCGKTALAV